MKPHPEFRGSGKQFVWFESANERAKNYEAFAVGFTALDNPSAWKEVQRHRKTDWPNQRFLDNVRAYTFENFYGSTDPNAVVEAWVRVELAEPEPVVIHKTRNGVLYARI